MSQEPDLDFLKDLPPPSDAPRRSRLHLTLQILAVPFLIVLIVGGIFVLISVALGPTPTLPELLKRIESGSGREKASLAHEFAQRLQAERGDLAEDAPPSDELRRLVPPILKMIARLQKDPSPTPEQHSTLRFLVQSLGIIRDPDSAPEILALMKGEEDEAVLADFLDVLGALRNPIAADAMIEKTRSSSIWVRKYAVFNLAALKTPEHVPVLEKFLEDDSSEVRWNAAFGLAFFHGDPSGAPVLRDMLRSAIKGKLIDSNDPNRAVLRSHAVEMAARALGVIRDREALPLLENLSLNDPNPRTRHLCREAMKMIRRDEPSR